MTQELGKIKVKRIPASQAKPGNAMHAKLLKSGARGDAPPDAGTFSKVAPKHLLCLLLIALGVMAIWGFYTFY